MGFMHDEFLVYKFDFNYVICALTLIFCLLNAGFMFIYRLFWEHQTFYFSACVFLMYKQMEFTWVLYKYLLTILLFGRYSEHCLITTMLLECVTGISSLKIYWYIPCYFAFDSMLYFLDRSWRKLGTLVMFDIKKLVPSRPLRWVLVYKLHGPIGLVEVRVSWPGHPRLLKKKKKSHQAVELPFGCSRSVEKINQVYFHTPFSFFLRLNFHQTHVM